jgi:hypothetical protein
MAATKAGSTTTAFQGMDTAYGSMATKARNDSFRDWLSDKLKVGEVGQQGRRWSTNLKQVQATTV